jgi:hypothetical protein
MPPGKGPNAHPDEKKLQVVFGVAIAAVVIGIVMFVILVVRDMSTAHP